jgi:hypothetical protein
MFAKVLEESDPSVLRAEEFLSRTTWRYIPEGTDAHNYVEILNIAHGRPLLSFRAILILSHTGP